MDPKDNSSTGSYDLHPTVLKEAALETLFGIFQNSIDSENLYTILLYDNLNVAMQ